MHVCQYGISGIRRAGVCVCVEGGGLSILGENTNCT